MNPPPEPPRLDATQLELIANAMEPLIVTTEGDREVGTIIWAVVADQRVYIRSFLGSEAKWYQRAVANPDVALEIAGQRIELTAVPATDAVSILRTSDGFRSKYEPGKNRDAMIRDDVLDTTLRLDPRPA